MTIFSVPSILRLLVPLVLTSFPLLQAGSAPAELPVRGKVLDQSRSAIPGAKIAATSPNGTIARTAVSGADGDFILTLEPGVYSLQVSADGFVDAAQQLTVINLSGAPIEVTLAISGQQTTVTVVEAGGYQVPSTASATKTQTPLVDIPQSVSIVSRELIKDQLMMSMADVVRYVPGITMAQGEGHRDAPVIRGNTTTSDFYVNGVRDDVQYLRDLYNLERVDAVKGPSAMIFGRGSGGGVINRVTKEAGFTPLRELSLQGGSFGNKRLSADVNQPFGEKLAFRLNGLYENSNSFRNYFNLERYGISPTLTVAPDDKTRIRLGYEYFRDARITDRGIPSFQGRPVIVNRSTFFGNPNESNNHAGVNLASAAIERQQGKLNFRNSTLFGSYDKFYGNVFPGAVNTAGTQVSLSGYNTGTQRNNVFNQTDVTYMLSTGFLKHTLLAGSEFGRQSTDNLRQTAFFNNSFTAVLVRLANPLDFTPVVWRQNATDADNRAVNNVAAAYVQDQVTLSRFVQVVAGVRVDRFALNVRNNRTSEDRHRTDKMISPRAGIVFKPRQSMSTYFNYSVSFLPSSGDQFASLDATTETLKPERFTSFEAGMKWDIRPALSFTSAIYRLNRTNTRSVDPNNPARILQTGSQRTNGFEAGLNGNITRKWNVAGGYALQDAFISSTTAAARLGAQIAMVPRHSLSMWNNYSLTSRFSAGLGLIRQTSMWAGVDNTVALPGFTRADAALFYSITEKMRIQANVENLTDNKYFINAHSNNNIMPGFARAVRIGLNVRF